ncbi:DUF4297 domain-containing protein [Lysinibacillus sp. NPDC056959]|uniref:DUF4297 domain-containing protein n=1 Tax=Lysinibacillus sp. NPDC056959 TaxID=3345981 RepID=UPI003641D332
MSEPMALDNGGAEAIKGFNFQKANLILLAINNYLKSNFKIYIEAEDGIVVTFDGYKAYIQVKKQVHSISSLLQKGKKHTIENEDGTKKTINKPSILEKNLSSGHDDDTFKIFVKNIKPQDIKNKFNIQKPGQICNILHKPTDEAKSIILSKLSDDYKDKLNNLYIHESPLSEEYNDSIKYLIGCLNDIEVSVDNKQGRAIIAELTLTIDEKANQKIEEISQKELKYMDTNYFSNLFITCKVLNKFNDILNSLSYNSIKKSRIGKERIKIDLTKTILKDEIKENILQIVNLEDLSDKEIIDTVVTNFNSRDEENTLIAIAIECICEIGE